MENDNKVEEKQPNFKERLNNIDNRIDDYKDRINSCTRISENGRAFLRKLDPNISGEEELINIVKKNIELNDSSRDSSQKALKSLYDERYEIEKEQRAYYRKEYEGYKESNNKETEKQADDGRVGE